MKINGFSATIDIQKAFGSVNHLFLISTLERHGFGDGFINWFKILPKSENGAQVMAVILYYYVL